MKYFSSLFLSLLISSFSCRGAITCSLSTFESYSGEITKNSMTPCCVDTASYSNGGTTFDYPPGLFLSAPTVRVSLEENGTAYSTNQVFVAEITANSSASTTIRVNLVTTSTITEASSNEIIVHIFAIEI